MPASPLDSAIYRRLFSDDEGAQLFTDSAELRAMMLVEGALARVQGEMGLIPELSARAIHRASLELQLDPGGLAVETGESAVVVPALVQAFRAAMQAPEHAQYLHWGATSQDISDTGLILRLRQVIGLQETRITEVLRCLAALAEAHAALPMAGRTWGQAATPTSFGAVAAGWGMPLVHLLEELGPLRERLLVVSLSGAAGTLSAMGPRGAEVRAGLAQALGRSDPGRSWHSTRDAIAAYSAWMTRAAASLGKMGEDLILMTQSDSREMRLQSSGGSSTMPQKRNPVQPTLLAAIARQSIGLDAIMQGAVIHRQQRDGVAWFTEWMSLPQICMLSLRALAAASEMLRGLDPDPARMLAGIDDGRGLIHAEALSFALTEYMPRPEAQMQVKALCGEVQAGRGSLRELAGRKWSEADLARVFDPSAQMGSAPAEARAFARDILSRFGN